MSSVRKNIIWLMLVHCSNYVFPLITLPYLVRVLGAENFGVLAIIQAISQYLILVTDFGFNFSTTRDISIHRENKEKVTSIFYSTMLAKMLLFMLSIGMLFFVSFLFSFVRENILLIMFSLLGVIGSIIYPIWLFQGLEQMAAISVFTTVAKIIVLFCTFLFIKTVEDLNIAVFINSLSLLIPGLLSLYYVYHKRMISRVLPDINQTFNQTFDQIKISFPLFISSVSTSFYTTMNTILMGWFCPAAMVGHYAAADKLRVAAQGLYNPVRQAVFPRAVAMSNNKNWLMLVIKKFGLPFIVFGLLMAISFSIAGPIVIKYYLGSDFELVGEYLLLMSPILFIVAISTVFGHWIMIAGGYSNMLAKVYLAASFLHMAYVIPLVKNLSANGMIISVILTELIISLILIFYVYINRSQINLAKFQVG